MVFLFSDKLLCPEIHAKSRNEKIKSKQLWSEYIWHCLIKFGRIWTLEMSLAVQKHSCSIDIMLQMESPAYKWIALTED